MTENEFTYKMIVAEAIEYVSVPCGYIATIPAGTEVELATNLPQVKFNRYWVKPWSGMTEDAQSYMRNEGFLLDECEVKEYHRFTYRLEQDDYPESPREYDNLGTMLCSHRNYNFGDENDFSSIGVWASEMLYDSQFERYDKDGYTTESWDDFIYDLENDDPDAISKALEMINTMVVILPLYVYDHGGITMRTYPFSSHWDSGQVGIIYVTYDDIRKEYGWKNITQKRRAQIEEYLKNEVATYDQYLTGDVWGYIITDELEEDEHIDSCFGFYGREYAEEEAKSMCLHFEKKAHDESVMLDNRMLVGVC